MSRNTMTVILSLCQEWLCRALALKHLVVPGEGGTIAHAELSFGNGMIMLGSVKKSEFDR